MSLPSDAEVISRSLAEPEAFGLIYDRHAAALLYLRPNLGFLAVVRKSDGRLIGRCGLSELVVDAKAAPGTIRRAWFQCSQAPTVQNSWGRPTSATRSIPRAGARLCD
jgi:hypothetical protein